MADEHRTVGKWIIVIQRQFGFEQIDSLEESRWFLHLQGSFWQPSSNSPQSPQLYSCKVSPQRSFSRYREFSHIRKLVHTKWDISVYWAWQKEIIFKRTLTVYSQQQEGSMMSKGTKIWSSCRFAFGEEAQAECYSVLKSMHTMGDKIWQHKD